MSFSAGRLLIALAAFMVCFIPGLLVRAAGPQSIALWPMDAPGAIGNEDKDRPSISVWLPENSTGTGIVVCPGGGYGHLAMEHEGREIAQWLNSLGVAAFVLDYRHRGKGYGHPAPLLDVQRAIRTVRGRGTKWNVQSGKIGVLGFSAGGHLASTAGTHFDTGNASADDAIERQSCRPDFMVLVYPVISFTTEHQHRGSRRNLLGEDPSEELVKSFSNELQVTDETPPTFLVHANDDRGVTPENSVLFYLALRKPNVPAELHIFSVGGHGFGLGKKIPGTSAWPDTCASWLRSSGFLPK